MIEDNVSASSAAGETSDGAAAKAGRLDAFVGSLAKLRARLDAAFTPKMRRAVAAVLAEQKTEIAANLRAHSAHVARNPQDTRTWFDRPKWDRRMTEALRPSVAGIAGAVNEHVASVFEPKKAAPLKKKLEQAAIAVLEAEAVSAAEQVAGNVFELSVLDRVLAKGAAKVVGINDTTMRDVQKLILRGIEQGLSPARVGDLIEGLPDAPTTLGNVISFDEYRAEMIARTEMMSAYNAAALASYADAGVEMVEPIDGDQDEECIARLDRGAVTLDEADADEDHPNGTLDWVPYFGEEVAVGKAGPTVMTTELVYDADGRVVRIVEQTA
jgi:hypothetical protein